jgi:hypothetical protein
MSFYNVYITPKCQKVKYAKSLGYIFDTCDVYEQAVRYGTAIEGQFSAYCRDIKIARIKYNDIITVRSPEPNMPPVDCVVVATNLSKRSKIPRTDILGTTEEPKWHCGTYTVLFSTMNKDAS